MLGGQRATHPRLGSKSTFAKVMTSIAGSHKVQLQSLLDAVIARLQVLKSLDT